MLSLERWKHISWVFFRSVLIIGISYVIIYPILVKLSTALKHRSDIYKPTVIWVPENWSLENFQIVIEIMNYWTTLANSVMLSGGTMLLQTASCALAGYAFAKLKFKGINILFALVIFTILVPPQTIMVPSYLNYKNFDVFGIAGFLTGSQGLKLIDTFWPFFISSITAMGLKNGLYIYIFTQFFRGLPKELEEAALVDGASVFKTFIRIMLPNAIPAIITVMLFSFVWQWNDTFFTTLYLSNSNVMATELANLPGNAEAYIGEAGKIDWFYRSMLTNTGVLLAILPLIIMYLFVQRHFVESVERSGLVG